MRIVRDVGVLGEVLFRFQGRRDILGRGVLIFSRGKTGESRRR